MLDFHNHIIPGVDDGASSDVEALAAVDALWAQGVRTMIATPHVNGSVTLDALRVGQRLGELDAGWERLNAAVRGRFPELTLGRGAEIMLDTPAPDLRDERLRLGGGRGVLVEYPYMVIPPQSSTPLDHVIAQGYVPVIAHPERYAGMNPASSLPREWRSHGALLQLNAGSLTGRYGPQARANALALLRRGEADFMCSDFHARGRPALTSALAVLKELGATEQADLLTIVNPRRMLNGESPIPVPPVVVRRTMMERVRQWLG